VQAQVLNLLIDLQADLGVSYVFISHDLTVVRHVADRVAAMYLRGIVETGPTEDVFAAPRHPYTAALLSAAPSLVPRKEPPIVLSGEVPSAVGPPSGCGFRTRCWLAEDVCAELVPADGASRENPDHVAACHLPLDVV
jgi:oligopeptide transport system ATP-binding protein